MDPDELQLHTKFIGPMPVINHFMHRLHLEEILISRTGMPFPAVEKFEDNALNFCGIQKSLFILWALLPIWRYAFLFSICRRR